MAKVHQRIFALLAAFLFLISSIGFSIYVLATMRNTPKDASQQNIQEQTNQPEEPTLQGTKLENFEPVEKIDSLQSIDLKPGDGEVIPAGATITFHYTGALAKDGTIFQSSHDTGQPVTFSLNQLIPGWQEGIPGMKVGGKRRLLIPSAKGYGDQASAEIPANSDLVFDIEVIELKQ